MQGKQTLSWKEWLQENVGIGDSYARKLHSILDVLGKFERSISSVDGENKNRKTI